MTLAQEVPKEFGCTISDPSNWLEYGATKERGLTFIDKLGKELDSGIFKHQSYFHLLPEDADDEKEEIYQLVYHALSEHFPFQDDEVRIVVNEYNRL